MTDSSNKLVKPILLGENYFKPIHQHFVNIMCTDSGSVARLKNNGDPIDYNFSAFIVEINEGWYAITAGHIFRQLAMVIRCGAIIKNWRMDDSILTKTDIPPPNHFSLDIDTDVVWFDEASGIDYAGFKIDFLLKEAITRKGITAISEKLWMDTNYEAHEIAVLVGTPSELCDIQHGAPSVKVHATIRLDLMKSPPADSILTEKEYKRIFAKIDRSCLQKEFENFDIGGMSGGPVFLIICDASEIKSYRIMGVQSAWDRSDVLAICAAPPFLKALKNMVSSQSGVG